MKINQFIQEKVNRYMAWGNAEVLLHYAGNSVTEVILIRWCVVYVRWILNGIQKLRPMIGPGKNVSR